MSTIGGPAVSWAIAVSMAWCTYSSLHTLPAGCSSILQIPTLIRDYIRPFNQCGWYECHSNITVVKVTSKICWRIEEWIGARLCWYSDKAMERWAVIWNSVLFDLISVAQESFHSYFHGWVIQSPMFVRVYLICCVVLPGTHLITLSIQQLWGLLDVISYMRENLQCQVTMVINGVY